MKTARLFKNGQSQAVRLPKEFRFDGTSVYVKRLGTYVVLIPKTDDPWKSMFEATHRFTADFMEQRDQGDQTVRENID